MGRTEGEREGEKEGVEGRLKGGAEEETKGDGQSLDGCERKVNGN